MTRAYTQQETNINRFYADVALIAQCLRTGRWHKLPSSSYVLHVRLPGGTIMATHALPVADLAGELEYIQRDGEIVDAIRK